MKILFTPCTRPTATSMPLSTASQAVRMPLLLLFCITTDTPAQVPSPNGAKSRKNTKNPRKLLPHRPILPPVPVDVVILKDEEEAVVQIAALGALVAPSQLHLLTQTVQRPQRLRMTWIMLLPLNLV